MSEVEITDLNDYFRACTYRGQMRPLIGNECTRTLLALLYPLRQENMLVRGDSGVGKTVMVDGMANLIWGESVFDDEHSDVVYVTGTSGKGLLNETTIQKWNDARFFIVPELQYMLKGENSTTEDILKTISEGKTYVYSRTAMRGSESDVVKLKLKPLASLFTIATENKYELGDELSRRMMTLQMDSNLALNEKIHATKADLRMLPRSEIYSGSASRLDEIRSHMHECMTLTSGHGTFSVPIYNPCAPAMQELIPKQFVISNSVIDYFLDVPEAIAAFYHPEREDLYEDGIFATPADNWMAWELAGRSIMYAALHVNDIGRELLEIVPEKFGGGSLGLEDYGMDFGGKRGGDDDYGMTIDEIADSLLERGMSKKKSYIASSLMNLVSAGYVNTNQRGTRFYKSKSHETLFDSGAHWEMITERTKAIMYEHWPEHADDYVERYCRDPVAPFHVRTVGDRIGKGTIQEIIPKKHHIIDTIDTRIQQKQDEMDEVRGRLGI